MTEHRTDRRLVVLRGEREWTAAEARRLLHAFDSDTVLWAGGPAPPVDALLGSSFGAVVLDLHDGLDADLLGRCHGFVVGGGALVLRMPSGALPPAALDERLAVPPHGPGEVGHRMWRRFERCVERWPTDASALRPPTFRPRGTEEQARLVHTLADAFASHDAELVAVLSDRGRGKSSALGLALRDARERSDIRAVVTSADRGSAAEVLRHAREPLEWSPPAELASSSRELDVIVVDEAAQLPVPLLRRLVRTHAAATIAFATTARGYEGTGRGFVLRFLEQLKQQARPLTIHTLEQPIRWAVGDPLERAIFEMLALDASPAAVTAGDLDPSELAHEAIDRDALARDETKLRELFGLLVHAHYRTTPSDLHRMLDAPNVRVHALTLRGRVVAATLLALEGELADAICAALSRGDRRIRGHALPETLVCHGGRPDAGRLSYVRSVRIAAHPDLRRLGLATRLVDEVHRSYSPDFFGTLFGATDELLRFRRAVGYELVRVGASRGSRTGEPAAVMVRAVSARARELLVDLRAELARDLPLQLELLAIDEGDVEPELREQLLRDLPPPAPLSAEQSRSVALGYATGARTYDAASFAITDFVSRNRDALEGVSVEARALLRARVLERQSWSRIATGSTHRSVRATMRAVRRAVRELVDACDPP